MPYMRLLSVKLILHYSTIKENNSQQKISWLINLVMLQFCLQWNELFVTITDNVPRTKTWRWWIVNKIWLQFFVAKREASEKFGLWFVWMTDLLLLLWLRFPFRFSAVSAHGELALWSCAYVWLSVVAGRMQLSWWLTDCNVSVVDHVWQSVIFKKPGVRPQTTK